MSNKASSVLPQEAPPSYDQVVDTGMEKNLQEAEVLREANDAIIQAAKSMDSVTIYFYDLAFSASGEVSVKEVQQTVKVKDYLAQFQNVDPAPLQQIFDMFNDKIDYNAFKTWADIERLHEQLGNLAVKFGMIHEVEQTRKMAAQLRVNLARINEVLKRIEKTLKTERSRLNDMQAKVVQVNSAITQLKLEVGVRVGPPPIDSLPAAAAGGLPPPPPPVHHAPAGALLPPPPPPVLHAPVGGLPPPPLPAEPPHVVVLPWTTILVPSNPSIFTTPVPPRAPHATEHLIKSLPRPRRAKNLEELLW